MKIMREMANVVSACSVMITIKYLMVFCCTFASAAMAKMQRELPLPGPLAER